MGKMWGTPLRASLQWDSGRRCEIRSGSDSVSREAVRAVRWASWRRWRCAGALLNPRDNRTDSPPLLPGPGRAPRSTDPLCPRPKRPPSPGTAWSQTRPSSPADAQTLWAVGSLHPRLGLEPPSARNSPLTRSRRRRQGTATSPTCLLAVTMLAYTRSSVLGGRLNYNRRPMKLCCLSPNEGYNKNNV